MSTPAPNPTVSLDPSATAVLSLDLQPGILGLSAAAASVLPQAARVAAWARQHRLLLLHVGVGFEAGYPELSAVHPRFLMLRERGLFLKGSPSAQIHPAIFQPGETVVYKHRISAFAGSALQTILSARQIRTLVLFGVSTSGVVLSTLRAASDLDFKCLVVQDACFDPDAEVHRVLTGKVFPSQATVLTAEALEAAVKGA